MGIIFSDLSSALPVSSALAYQDLDPDMDDAHQKRKREADDGGDANASHKRILSRVSCFAKLCADYPDFYYSADV